MAGYCDNCGGFETKHAAWCYQNVRVAVEKDLAAEQAAHATTKATEPDQHPLYPVFMAAIAQATGGKGKRHGGAITPFLEQPWKHYAKLHGRGFLTGQAAKKLEEAASTRHGEAFETEVFGAMVYLGMAILAERIK